MKKIVLGTSLLAAGTILLLSTTAYAFESNEVVEPGNGSEAEDPNYQTVNGKEKV